MLTLVAPSSMTVDQQTLWLASAVDALEDIRADEVRQISAEVRRSAVRHNQIVPMIAKMVAERRERQSRDRQRNIEVEESRKLLPARKHISDRDRRTFGPDDWAELNIWLESQGAGARYRSDGTRYFMGII